MSSMIQSFVHSFLIILLFFFYSFNFSKTLRAYGCKPILFSNCMLAKRVLNWNSCNFKVNVVEVQESKGKKNKMIFFLCFMKKRTWEKIAFVHVNWFLNSINDSVHDMMKLN